MTSLVTLVGFLIHKGKTDPLIRSGHNKIWLSSTPVIIFFLFTFWLWIQQIWALKPDTHLSLAILYSKYLLMFYLFYRCIENEEDLYKFCLGHVIGCAYLGWIAYSTSIGGRFEHIGSAGIDDANALATHLATGLITAGFLWFRADRARKLILLLCIPFILNAIILTQSRGALLGVACAGLVALFVKPVAFKRQFYLLALGGIFGFIVLLSGSFMERLQETGGAESIEELDKSARSRIVLIEAQFRMFQESPILGHGHRGTAALSPIYLDSQWLTKSAGDSSDTGARSSHNTFFTVLVEQGLPGILMYLLLVAWTALKIRKLNRWQKATREKQLSIYIAIVACSLTALLSAGQFADYLKHEVMIWMFVIFAVVLRLYTERSVAPQAASTVRVVG